MEANGYSHPEAPLVALPSSAETAEPVLGNTMTNAGQTVEQASWIALLQEDLFYRQDM